MSDAEKLCDYTGSCATCKTVEDLYRIKTTEPNLIVLHTDRVTICSGKKSKEKKTTLYKLEKITSALRNSKGGQVLVHIDGQRDNDCYLEYFDEFITRSFTDLIEDGQLYVKAYNRQWLSELEAFNKYRDFVLLTVNESAGISTVDFNTKISNDIENLKPQVLSIAQILFSQHSSVADPPKLRGLLEIQQLHENRRIEIKAFKPRPDRLSVILRNPENFVDYIWRDLKLREALTSMSKVVGGGSFFVGISEVETTDNGYRTKIPQIDGFVVPGKQDLSRRIYCKVREACRVLRGERFEEVPEKLCEVGFHEVQDSNPQKYVLEVAIGYYNGIVFYDKEGPTAYGIKRNELYRMDKYEWLKRFENCFKSCVPKN